MKKTRAMTEKPKTELEVQLLEWGCPYKAEDQRSLVWLAGYRKGFQAGHEMTQQVFKETFQ